MKMRCFAVGVRPDDRPGSADPPPRGGAFSTTPRIGAGRGALGSWIRRFHGGLSQKKSCVKIATTLNSYLDINEFL